MMWKDELLDRLIPRDGDPGPGEEQEGPGNESGS